VARNYTLIAVDLLVLAIALGVYSFLNFILVPISAGRSVLVSVGFAMPIVLLGLSIFSAIEPLKERHFKEMSSRAAILGQEKADADLADLKNRWFRRGIGFAGLAILALIGLLVAYIAAMNPKASEMRSVPDEWDCDGARYAYSLGAKKGAEFAEMQLKLYSFSKGTPLGVPLLEQSVARDIAEGRPYLKYNYVIDPTDCEIYVATWTVDQETQPTVPSVVACRDEDRGWNARRGHMIDIFQEQREDGVQPTSPCWLQLASVASNENFGILDGMSKHFILAQPGGEKSVSSMQLWKADRPKVAYAGEIVVNVNQCTYGINGNSGTYKPDKYKIFQGQVERYFGSKLGVRPSSGSGTGDKIRGCTPSKI
jgi:hypothetical protein